MGLQTNHSVHPQLFHRTPSALGQSTLAFVYVLRGAWCFGTEKHIMSTKASHEPEPHGPGDGQARAMKWLLRLVISNSWVSLVRSLEELFSIFQTEH